MAGSWLTLGTEPWRSIECPQEALNPWVPGPVTCPPKGCLWAIALATVEVGLTPAPFMPTLVFLPEADRMEVSRFAKNFLPILFNLYGQPVAAEDTPAPRRAVRETVKTYLTITDPQVSWREEHSWVSDCGLGVLERPHRPGLTWALPSGGQGSTYQRRLGRGF